MAEKKWVDMGTAGPQERVSSKKTKGKQERECVVIETKEGRLNTLLYSSAAPEMLLDSELWPWYHHHHCIPWEPPHHNWPSATGQ